MGLGATGRLDPRLSSVFSTSDTIVAIATPPGRGGLGVVRLSGPEAHGIARRLVTLKGPLEPRRATFTRVRPRPDTTYGNDSAYEGDRPRLASGFRLTDAIDQVIAIYFHAPASSTGDDVVELSAHGSPVVLRGIVTSAVACGARLAEAGEFTLRAFLNGRIDLMQAEAVADLVDAVTPLQARAAFDQLQGTLTRTIGEIDAALFDLIARLEASVDFPEEGYHFVAPGALATSIGALVERTTSLLANARRGRLVREGLQMAIVGKPNVGKSSVFNALVGAARAIVTDRPGTTRDLVTEVVDLAGLRVTLVDTAGLRDPTDYVEAEGVDRARRAQAVSDLILVVLDGSQGLDENDKETIRQVCEYKRLIVINKVDIRRAWSEEVLASVGVEKEPAVVSAKTQAGFDTLRQRIVEALDIECLAERPEITNVRHIALVQRAHDALLLARAAAQADGGSLSEEFVLADLQTARTALEEIAGRRAPEDLLAQIFSRFCIGK